MALRALLALSGAAARMRAEDIAEVIGTTPGYVPHVMRPLTAAGWVQSTRGPSGGYRLNVPTTEISVLDVIEAEEGRIDTTKCVLRGGPCERPAPCAVHASWTAARGALLGELAAATVASTTDQGETTS